MSLLRGDGNFSQKYTQGVLKPITSEAQFWLAVWGFKLIEDRFVCQRHQGNLRAQSLKLGNIKTLLKCLPDYRRPKTTLSFRFRPFNVGPMNSDLCQWKLSLKLRFLWVGVGIFNHDLSLIVYPLLCCFLCCEQRFQRWKGANCSTPNLDPTPAELCQWTAVWGSILIHNPTLLLYSTLLAW